MKNLHFIFCFVLGFFFLSCDDNRDGPFISNFEGEGIYSPGDTVEVELFLLDDESVIFFTAINRELNLVYSKSFMAEEQHTDIKVMLRFVTDPDSPPGEYMIDLSAVDIDGNRAEELIYFHLE